MDSLEADAVRLDQLLHTHRGVLVCDANIWQRLRSIAAHHPEVAVLLPEHKLFDAAVAIYHQYEFSHGVCVLLSSSRETQAFFRLCEMKSISDEILWECLFS